MPWTIWTSPRTPPWIASPIPGDHPPAAPGRSRLRDRLKLTQPHLLAQGNLEDIIYSLTLYERTPHGNLLRVQTDTLNQPLDMNQGSKMDLGSTAKLRTLVTYLETIERLYHAYAGTIPAKALGARTSNRLDPLSRWAVTYFLTAPDQSLSSLLQAALDRQYSGSPTERFWTGGGTSHFCQFQQDGQWKTIYCPRSFSSLREFGLYPLNA